MNKTQNLSIIILAAGKGTRMKSALPKVMHKVLGREMLNMVIDEAKKLNPQDITIVISEELTNYQGQICKIHQTSKINFILQKERLGTAHAVKTAINSISQIPQNILVLYGDTPLIKAKTLEKMLAKIAKDSLAILSFDCFSENKYGRLVTDKNDNLKAIVEFKDADESQKNITLCNSGVMAIQGKNIKELLDEVKNDNAAKEFYLTDLVKIAKNKGLNCSHLRTKQEEVLGVNSRAELAQIEEIKQNEMRANFMEQGVTLLDPKTVYFAFDTEIENDVIIYQNVVFGKNVKVASGVEIKAFSHIEGAEIGANSTIGPFARIRPETKIGEDVKIGNFVEVKKSEIKNEAKISHLSYVGDSIIGENANIGAGTITCNYDGYKKFKTEIGKNVFVGSNSALIAPVKIKDNAVIGAGSIISKDVEEDELAVTRAKQLNIKDGGKTYHKKKSGDE